MQSIRSMHMQHLTGDRATLRAELAAEMTPGAPVASGSPAPSSGRTLPRGEQVDRREDADPAVIFAPEMLVEVFEGKEVGNGITA
jgi:hypothetical protein